MISQAEYERLLLDSGALLMLGPKHAAEQAFAAATNLQIAHATIEMVSLHSKQRFSLTLMKDCERAAGNM